MNQVTDAVQKPIYSRAVQRGDYERIRDLLVQTQAITPLGFNWDIRRWEGKCWYNPQADGNPHWHKNSQLWEMDTGQPVGLVHPDGLGFPYWLHETT